MHIWLVDRFSAGYQRLSRQLWAAAGVFAAFACLVAALMRFFPDAMVAFALVLAAAFVLALVTVRSAADAARVFFVRDGRGRLFCVEARGKKARALLAKSSDLRIPISAHGHEEALRAVQLEQAFTQILAHPDKYGARCWQLVQVKAIREHRYRWEVQALARRLPERQGQHDAVLGIVPAKLTESGSVAATPKPLPDALDRIEPRRFSFTMWRMYVGQDQLDRALKSRLPSRS